MQQGVEKFFYCINKTKFTTIAFSIAHSRFSCARKLKNLRTKNARKKFCAGKASILLSKTVKFAIFNIILRN